MAKKKRIGSKKTVMKFSCGDGPVSGGYSSSSECVTVGDWASVSASFLFEQDYGTGSVALYQFEKVSGPLCLGPEDVYDLEKDWGFGLVGFLASRFHVNTALLNMCEGWNVPLQYYTLHSGWLVFRSGDAASRARVLNGGPYFLCGQPLLLRNMPKYFSFNEDDTHFLPVWIKLPELPLECCDPRELSHIASMVGKPIPMDELTHDCVNLSCARVLVVVDATKPLVRSVRLTLPDGEERDQQIYYEYEPKYCLNCKSIGNSSTNCMCARKDLSSAPARRQPRPASRLKSKQPASCKNVETEMHLKSGQNATPKQNGALDASDHNLSQNTAGIEQLSINSPKSQGVDNGKSGESDVLGDAVLSSAADLTREATCNKDPKGKAMVVDQDVQAIIPPMNSSLGHGEKIDLAAIRARKAMEGRRHPPRAPWVKSNNHRDVVAPRESSRRRESLAQSDRLRDSDPKSHQVIDLSHSGASGKRKDHGSRSTEDVRRRGEDDTSKSPMRGRDEERGASPKITRVDHLFVDGVNQKDDAGSFWDLNDPDIGWKRGRELVGDFDMLHLLPKSTDSLTHSLAWNACQTLSLASAFRVREERFRNSEDKLRDELAKLREENKRLGEERAKAKDEWSRLQKELDEKLKTYNDVRKDRDQQKEKYSIELETGQQFLNSSAGKALLTSTGEKAIEAYRASSAFTEDVFKRAMTAHDEIVVDCRRQLRETGLVAEDIIMMIEPSVPEPVEGNLGDLLGDIGDAEMIEALNHLPANGANDEL